MTLPDTSIDVPHVAGVWSRQWEEDPLGSGVFDRDTLVHWTQAPCGIYVDIRLPLDSPGRSLDAAAAAGFVPNPSCLAADGSSFTGEITLAPQVVYETLMSQKSFAGQLMMAWGDTTSGVALECDVPLAELSQGTNAAIPLCTCYWRRDMDYRPPSGGLDVGVCASGPILNEDDGTIEMRETGDDGSYAEGWLRLPGTGKGPFMALELVEDSGVPRRGFWVRAGRHFAYAVGRPSNDDAIASLNCEPGSDKIADQVGKSLMEATSEDKTAALRQAMSYVAVVGTIRDDGRWYIESSTRPDLVGCALIESASPGNLTCSALINCRTMDQGEDQFVTQVSTNTTEDSTARLWERTWRVLEMTGCELPIV